MSVNKKNKEYTNGDITVIWDAARCIHSGDCVRGLPGVFRPQERPWINMKGGSSEDISATVRRCPSGALALKKEEGSESPGAVKIGMKPNGPYVVSGTFELFDPEGNLLQEGEKISLCRCGHSTKMPVCDGTHKKIGFEG